MKTFLLDRFGIATPENFEDCNLIGIDFGDGELSASSVMKNMDGSLSVQSLALVPNGTKIKNVNAFYISPKETKLIYNVDDNRYMNQDGGIRYYNYKKCPGDEVAGYKYKKDDSVLGELTYREVMVKCFNCLVNVLFESNETLSRKKKTIILVGRPSSAGWESSELEYARMLQKGLVLPEEQNEVFIAIAPESTAALASEMDPKLDKQRVNQKEIVVILDSGSSTFDITVVGPNGVVGEDSYQFGGNQLDENLLELLKRSVEAYSPGAELETEHGHKLALRILKEDYYGIRGTGKMPQLYMPDLKNVKCNGLEQEFEFRVDKRAMQKALEEMPVRAFRFEKGLSGKSRKMPPKTYKSWINACEEIYSYFYNKMSGYFTKPGDEGHTVVPDRIILSGGVSVMPEVQAAVKRVFGVQPTISPRPNYSVSLGLGYVLGTEIRKKQLLNKLFSELANELPDVDSLLKSIGDAGEDEEWGNFVSAAEDWLQSPGYHSIVNLKDLWSTKYFNRDLEASLRNGAERWYKDKCLEKMIRDMLRRNFVQLFPDYTQQFSADLSDISFDGLGKTQVKIDDPFRYCAMEGNTFKDDQDLQNFLNAPRDKDWRRQIVIRLRNAEHRVRKGGEFSFNVPVTIEKGLIFKRYEQEIRKQSWKYDGIRKMYLNDNAITRDVAVRCRTNIMELLHSPIKDFVENITPYFNMTAQQSMDSKV